MRTLTGIVAVVGNYGSGKTEVSINLAVLRNREGTTVRVVDLDLVNPYFRSREARKLLTALGIEVILPDAAYMNADLPILSPRVAGSIRMPAPLTLLDLGGDDAGATVMAALADALKAVVKAPFHMLQVVNPFRPETETPEGCDRIRNEIEAAAKQRITGIVGNAHLMDETTTDTVYAGHAFVSSVAGRLRLPLLFITAPAALTSALDDTRLTCPVLPISRQLVPPWKTAGDLT